MTLKRISSLAKPLPGNLKIKMNKKGTGGFLCNQFGQSMKFVVPAAVCVAGHTVPKQYGDSPMKRSIQVVAVPPGHAYLELLSAEQQAVCHSFEDQLKGLAKLAMELTFNAMVPNPNLLEKKRYFETCAKVFYNGFSYAFSHLAQKYQSEELNEPIVFVTKTRNGVSEIEMTDELLQGAVISFVISKVMIHKRNDGVNCVMMELGRRITVLKKGNVDDLEEDMSGFPQMGYIEASTGSTGQSNAPGSKPTNAVDVGNESEEGGEEMEDDGSSTSRSNSSTTTTTTTSMATGGNKNTEKSVGEKRKQMGSARNTRNRKARKP